MKPILAKIILFTCLFIISASASAFAKKILDAKERTSLLEDSRKSIVSSTLLDRESLSDVTIPFIYIETASNEPRIPIEMTDEDILAYAVKNYLPRGRVFRNGQYYLIFDLSIGMLKEGDMFPVKLDDTGYRVLIQDINPTGYVFRFKDFTKEVNFSDIKEMRNQSKLSR